MNTEAELTSKSAGFGSSKEIEVEARNTYRPGTDQRICQHVEDASSDESSDDSEAVQLRPNPLYALPHRERIEERDLLEDRLNRQAFGESGTPSTQFGLTPCRYSGQRRVRFTLVADLFPI